MTAVSATLTLGQAGVRLFGSVSDATAPAAAGATPGLTQDRAFTSFASAILGALGSAGGSGNAGTATDAAPGGSRVDAVALALANALGSASGGSDPVAGLLGTISSALDQASKALVQAGYSRDAVQGFVADFRNALATQLDALAAGTASGAPAPSPPPATPDVSSVPAATAAAPSTTPGAGSTTAAPATGSGDASSATTATGSAPSPDAGTFRVTDRGELQLVTTQGDVVTIRFRTSASGTLGAGSGASGAAAYAAVAGTADRSRFSVSVQGSLNPDELKAINDVLGQVDTLATQFFSGNFAQAFASAAALSADPTEIAGVALKLSERVSLVLPAATAAPADATGTPAAPASAPSTSPSTTDTAGSSATTSPAAPAPTTASDPASATPAAATSAPGVLSSLFSFLTQVLSALGTPTTQGQVTLSAKAKLTLLSNAVGANAGSTTRASGAAFLKLVVDAVVDGAPATPSAAATGAGPSSTAAA